MSTSINFMSWNLHKGFDALGRHVANSKIAHALFAMPWDVCFLQEVPGHAIEYLTQSCGLSASYGFTRSVGGHHFGNAILAKRGALTTNVNVDISASKMESRRLLAADWIFDESKYLLISTHFGLLPKWRVRQAAAVDMVINGITDGGTPIIMGGDFNDHTRSVSRELARQGFHQLTKPVSGRSFPALFPLLMLDRIYGKDVVEHRSSSLEKPILKWADYSDHCPVVASVRPRVASAS